MLARAGSVLPMPWNIPEQVKLSPAATKFHETASQAQDPALQKTKSLLRPLPVLDLTGHDLWGVRYPRERQALQDLVDVFANDFLAAKKVQRVKKDTH